MYNNFHIFFTFFNRHIWFIILIGYCYIFYISWYIYFDLSTGIESSGNYTAGDILATTDYSIVNTDDRGLLALAAVSTDYSQAVAIQTFSSKIGNFNHQ